MFDIGFWEVLIISVLALLVIGPERLPDVARKAGRMIGKVRRFVNSVRSDLERELRTDELEKMLNQQNEQIQELKNILNDTASTVESELKETEQLVHTIPDETEAKAKAKAETETTDSKKLTSDEPKPGN